ncbi:hypothetical protein RN15_3116 [Mycobacterium tuberculosis]|nr:hypothetical protein RN15_3116 [Mycobacterium tuberculosis]
MVPPCFIRINVKLAVKELSVAIASAAQPRAAGRHHQTPWRSQARRSRAQRVATIRPRGDRKRGAAARSGSPPSDPVAIASAAQPRAAGRHHQTPWRSQARRSRAQRVATIKPRGDRKRGAAARSGSPPSNPVAIASAAQPRAAGRHHQTPWRSQARRSRAQRVATIKPRGDRKRGAAARSGSPPSNPVAIASAAQPRAAGRHLG